MNFTKMIKQFFLAILTTAATTLPAQQQIMAKVPNDYFENHQVITEIPNDYFDFLNDTIYPIELKRAEYWYGHQNISCDTNNVLIPVKRFVDPLTKVTFCAYYNNNNDRHIHEGWYTIIKTINTDDTTGNSAVIWQIASSSINLPLTGSRINPGSIKADSIKLIKMGKAVILSIVWENDSGLEKTLIDLTKELILFHGALSFGDRDGILSGYFSDECERSLYLQGNYMFLSKLGCVSTIGHHYWNDSLYGTPGYKVEVSEEVSEIKGSEPKQYVYKNGVLVSVSKKNKK